MVWSTESPGEKAHMRTVTRLWVVAIGLMAWGATGVRAEAQQKVPLITLTASSFERLMGQAVTTFEAAGRPELAETLGTGLARVNDLKGMARNQPMGVMVYLNGLSPTTVAFVPTKNIDDLLKTVELAPVSTKKLGENQYEIVGPNRTLYLKVQGDYSFVATDSTSLESELPDPLQSTRKLTASYDIAASINLRGLDPATRQLAFNILKAQAENGLQRRDNEPEIAFEMRQADGERTLAAIEILLNQGEEILLGWTVSPTERVAALEAIVTATPGSEYAAYFGEMKGTTSRFSNLLNTENPVALSMSWKLDKPSRKSMRRTLAAVQKELLGQLAKEDSNTESEDHPIRQLIRVLDSTAVAGHLDMVAQMVGKPTGPFSFVGGVKLEDTGVMADAMEDLLGRLKGRPQIENVRLNYSTHNGVNIHRLDPQQPSSGENRLFGGPVSVFLAVDQSVMWFAVGADEASTELKRAMDKVAAPVETKGTAVPMQMVWNVSQFLELFDPGNTGTGMRGLARSAFKDGGDALRAEVLPVTDGMRFRLQFDEAFLKFAGSALARQIER